MSSGIRQAEQLRRKRGVLGAVVALLVVAAALGVWRGALGDMGGVLTAIAVLLGGVAILGLSLRGYVRLAGYAVALLPIAATLAGSVARGQPANGSFLVSLGVVLAATSLQTLDVLVVFGVGLAGQAFLGLWPYEGAEPPSGAAALGEGLLVYLATGGVALLIASSIARLVDDLRRRDAEARQASERNEALAAQLEQAQRMEALARLAGGVAHDFNNLLTVMRGCATLLEGAVPAGTEASTDLKDLGDAVDRGSQLTRQLLAFSKRDVVQPGLQDLRAVVDGMRDLLQRMVGLDVELSLSASGGPFPVWASLSQLEQVVMNLAVNARDAMEGRGKLSVRVERGADAKLGTACRLVVQDSGAGMSEEVKARLFEPFFTTKGPHQGTGLGLATVHSIVTRLGGHIDVESSVGQGATFRVSLPVAQAVTPRPPAPAARPGPSASLTVCVVDDESPLRNQMARVLGSAGLTVRAFSSAEALLAAGPHACDVLVTDVNLPGESGLALAEQARARHPGLRVVLVSGYTADPSATARLVEQGAIFLPKPFDPAALVAAVTSSRAAP